MKIDYIFPIFTSKINWGYSLESPQWGGPNVYPQFMFKSQNKKNNVLPRKLYFP